MTSDDDSEYLTRGDLGTRKHPSKMMKMAIAQRTVVEEDAASYRQKFPETSI